ncbi:MAG: homogentisate phytyltransferase [Chloroflexi bacterium]|nr:homogentisate phytyltransferase [Chloroflexota bacterium]MCI0579813.1 homogentisate phytyltransferase [Chloroflexota bacterium]MCI0647249.1 homogentisate phytyltransferase [Chloroflexota bacterium]MCI0728903.1 homogentisate phytyltransferase [Chloroflexota bacterium]
MAKLLALLHFSRPHTIVATGLQVTGLFILAGGRGVSGWAAWLLALASCLAANVYIVGLNQLADVAIDRVNKPYLPLASGAFSMRQGRAIVLVAGLLAVGLAASQGSYLLLTVSLSMVIGTIYSLPPLHLKSRPLWAALSIAFVRGVVANVGLSLHFHQAFQPAAGIPWLLLAGLAVFFFGFGLVIALYKDIPDLRGDRQFGIHTFTVRLGPARVFQGGRWLLTGFYLAPIGAGVFQLPRPDGAVLLVSHLLIVALFWGLSRSVDPAKPAAITRFYLFLWGLFYVEYILLSLWKIGR